MALIFCILFCVVSGSCMFLIVPFINIIFLVLAGLASIPLLVFEFLFLFRLKEYVANRMDRIG